MEDSWIFVDDDDDSSHCSLADSDKIDSETEAELYSKIHYDNSSYTNSENLNEKTSEFLVYSPFNDTFGVDREKNASTPIKLASEHLFQITHDNFSNGKRKSSEIDPNCKESGGKKHKSDSERDLSIVNLDSENINESSQYKINNNEVEEIIFVAHSESKCNEKVDTVVIESSDSDNDFWIEPSSVGKTDLQINLLKDIDPVFLSSSDDESDVSSPFMKRDSILKNLSMPNLNTDESAEGLWHINFEDLHRSKRHSRRYHESIDVTCSNCSKKGHTFRTCPSPRVIKCFFCGGNHLGSRCSSRMCSNCYAPGHDRRNCWQQIGRMFCQLCNIEGHSRGNCPDLWRRYHLTTKPTGIIKAKRVKQDTNIYCWNCGKYGHFGGVCPLRSSFKTWPCVISYESPKYILQKERYPFLIRYPHLSFAKPKSKLNSNLEKQDILIKSRNELNVSSGSNGENRENKGGKKKLSRKLKKKLERSKQVQDIVKEKNFPRTPKRKISVKSLKMKFENDASAKLLIKKETNRLKKQFISQRKSGGLQNDGSVQNDHLERNNEDSVPESVKILAKKRFQNWKRKTVNKLKKRQQQNKSKGRELTNS